MYGQKEDDRKYRQADARTAFVYMPWKIPPKKAIRVLIGKALDTEEKKKYAAAVI